MKSEDRAREAVRIRIERREETLSPYALKSKEAVRERPEEPSPVRAEYQRDRDRVVHSNSFRRLKHKSQVFVNPQGDHYTTRLTHVLQVSQIGRTVARALNLNEDLVEAASLAHDVGHTPFGHIGEKVLDRLLPNGFSHSRQGVRTLKLLEKRGAGLNLTTDVLAIVSNHSKPEGKFIDSSMVEDLSLEAQIVRISDAVAYLAHDLTDALRAGVIASTDVPKDVTEALGVRHSGRIDAIVRDIVDTSWDCTGESPGSNCEKPWIRMSQSMIDITTRLRNFMFERVYKPTSDSIEGHRAAEIVEILFDHYVENPKDIPEWIRMLSLESEYAASDYVCGMTDSYALIAAEHLKPGIGENLFQGKIRL